jgi:hypothetical protein
MEIFREVQAKPPKPEWTPPRLEDFQWRVPVQAIDQNLTNTGVIRLRIVGYGTTDVLFRETIKPEPAWPLDGFSDMFERAYLLRNELVSRLVSMDTVIETPAVQGYHRDSSLLAAQACWDAVRGLSWGTRASLVSKQHVGKILCNDPKASKAQIKAAVCRYIPEAAKSTDGWNEHTRDAVAIALTRLYDLKREMTGG